MKCESYLGHREDFAINLDTSFEKMNVPSVGFKPTHIKNVMDLNPNKGGVGGIVLSFGGIPVKNCGGLCPSETK